MRLATQLDRLKIKEMLQNSVPSAFVQEYLAFSSLVWRYPNADRDSTFYVVFAYPSSDNPDLVIRIADNYGEGYYRMGIMLFGLTNSALGKRYKNYIANVTRNSADNAYKFKRTPRVHLNVEFEYKSISSLTIAASTLAKSLVAKMTADGLISPVAEEQGALVHVPVEVNKTPSSIGDLCTVNYEDTMQTAVLLDPGDSNFAVVGLLSKFDKIKLSKRVILPYNGEALSRLEQQSLIRFIKPGESTPSYLSRVTKELLETFTYSAGDYVKFRHGTEYVTTIVIEPVGVNGKLVVRHPFFLQRRLPISPNKLYPATPKEVAKYKKQPGV